MMLVLFVVGSVEILVGLGFDCLEVDLNLLVEVI
jgi:hypothetical protein